jgi:hypothetical protein
MVRKMSRTSPVTETPSREQVIECISRFDVFSTAAQVADAVMALYAKKEPQTLSGVISAVYGKLDVEDCARVDREWARMRGYILPVNGTSGLAPTPADREAIGRVLYECEKRRATNADAVVKGAFPGASDALLMEPWDECKDAFLSDADAVLAALSQSSTVCTSGEGK